MRLVALSALAACYEPPPPQVGDLVVYQVSEIGDVAVSGDTIWWTDGPIVREAVLSDVVIGNREAVAVGETRAPLVVHRDSAYLVDLAGVLQVTAGTATRVVDELGVNRVFVADDGSLYWAHSTATVSWFEAGDVRSAFMDADAVTELALNQGELYAATIGSYAGQLGLNMAGKLFHIDPTGAATELADARDFAGDFLDNHFEIADIYKSRGLFSFGDQLYWGVHEDPQDSQYQQSLVVEATASGFPIVLGPQERSSEFWVSDGAFYWSVDSELWRARPDAAPEHVVDGFIRASTIADGYIYGFVESLSGDGFDLRRVAAPD